MKHFGGSLHRWTQRWVKICGGESFLKDKLIKNNKEEECTPPLLFDPFCVPLSAFHLRLVPRGSGGCNELNT